jgi:hypothetical protein
MLGEAAALHSKAQLWHSIAIRSNGKAKMDNVMAEQGAVERRHSMDFNRMGKALNCIATAKQ